MLDPRTTLARGGVARSELEGLTPADRFVEVKGRACAAPRAAIRAGPESAAEQVDQLLFGERFDVLDICEGYAMGQAARDGYVGWVETSALAKVDQVPTHRVSALRTFAFATPSIKSAYAGPYSLNALVTVVETDGPLAHAQDAGWIPRAHLTQIGEGFEDPAAVAERFLGAPYLWGGRDSLGLDCSGLVQQAFYAAGWGCPRDADQQAGLGREIARVDLRRGDLVFWRGHVGMMVDASRFIHANGHHMAVVIEDLEVAVSRIAAAGSGAPTAFRRVNVGV